MAAAAGPLPSASARAADVLYLDPQGHGTIATFDRELNVVPHADGFKLLRQVGEPPRRLAVRFHDYIAKFTRSLIDPAQPGFRGRRTGHRANHNNAFDSEPG